MGKRDINIVEANLPAAPPVHEFTEALQKWADRQEKRPLAKDKDPVHGTFFQKDAPTKKRGTIGTELCGVQCALTFARLCKDLGADYTTLDEWCIAWARWVIAPVH